MFGLGPATRVYLAIGATDMQKGFEGLYGLVRDRLGLEVQTGHLFLFSNARRNRLKVLYWDGNGLWVCAKRLEKGRFSWPLQSEESDRVMLSHEELAMLLGGIDLSRTRRKNWYRKEVELGKKNVRKKNTVKSTLFFASYSCQLSVNFTTLKALDPTLVSQLKETLPAALFEKLNGAGPPALCVPGGFPSSSSAGEWSNTDGHPPRCECSHP